MKVGNIREANWHKCLFWAVIGWLVLYVGTWFIGGIVFWLVE